MLSSVSIPLRVLNDRKIKEMIEELVKNCRLVKSQFDFLTLSQHNPTTMKSDPMDSISNARCRLLFPQVMRV